MHGSYYNNDFYFTLTHSVKFKCDVFKMPFCGGSLNDSFSFKVL